MICNQNALTTVRLVLMSCFVLLLSGCFQSESKISDPVEKLDALPLEKSIIWKFDEGTGAKAMPNDAKCASFNLKKEKSSPLWSTGVKGKSLNFLGRGMAIGRIPEFFAIDKDFTIDLFLKLSKGPAGTCGGIFDLMNYHKSGFRILTDMGGNISWIIQAPNDKARDIKVAGPKLTYGKWHHLAFVKNKNTLEIYLDNERVQSQVLAGEIKAGPERIFLGYTGGPKYYINGLMDELRLSNYPKTDFAKEKKLAGDANALDAAKLAATVKSKSKTVKLPGKAVNLLENGGFESGMSLWNYKLFSRKIPYDATWALDDKVKSSGEYSLRLEKTLGMMLDLHVVELKPGNTYTFAADLKSDIPGAIAQFHAYDVRNGWGKVKIKKNFHPSKDWRRYSHTFKIPNDATNHFNCGFYLKNNTKATIWIDRVTICPGDAVEPEKPEIPFGLTTSKSDNCYFSGEKVELRVNFTPPEANPGGKIRLRALDPRGKELWRQEVPPKSQSVAPPLEQGTYCIKAAYENAEGKLENEISVRLAVIPPGAPSRFFGLQYGYGFYPKQAYEDAAKRLWKWGALTGRYNLMSAQGMLDLKDNSPWLNQLRISKKQGIEVYVCLCGYDTHRRKRHIFDMNKNGQGVVTPENLERWEAALRNFLKHAAPYIDGVELFNEPNCWKDDQGRVLSGGDYVKALKLTYQTVKGMYPKMKVYGPSITGLPRARMKFVEEILQAGGGNYMDALSFHPYGARENDEYAQIKYLKDLVDKYKPGLALVDSELCNSNYHNPKHRDRRRWGPQSIIPYLDAEVGEGERGQARHQLKVHLTEKALGVEFFTHHVDGGQPTGVMVDMSGVPNLSGTAEIFMCRLLHQAEPLGPLTISDFLRCFVFKLKDGRSAAVLWSGEKGLDCQLRIAAAPADFEMFDISGRKIPLTGELDFNLSLDGMPVYLVSKNQSIEDFQAKLKKSQLTGVTNPVAVVFEALNQRKLRINFKNRLSQPIAVKGQASVVSGPLNKKIAIDLPKLLPGKIHCQIVELDKPLPSGIGEFHFQGRLNGESDLNIERKFNPVFCHPAEKVVIDGELSEWNGIEPMTMAEDYLIVFDHDRGLSGPEDHRAKVWLGHDRNNFYFAAEVADEKHVQPDTNNTASWMGDGIQFFFDPLGDSASGVSGEADDYRFTMSLPTDTSKAPVLTRDRVAQFELCSMRGTGEISTAVIPHSVKRRDGKTFYEIRFPKSQLAPLDPALGAKFRFSFVINDNDRKPEPGAKMKKRDSGLSLTGKGTQPFAHPELYSDVILPLK